MSQNTQVLRSVSGRAWTGLVVTGLMALVEPAAAATGSVMAEPSVVAATEQAVARASVTTSPQTIPFGVWLGALTELLDSPVPAVQKDYREFLTRHRLSDDPTLSRDYQRLRLLFEAVRDGGFWHLRWAITDKAPSSRAIWRSWIQDPVRSEFAAPSATAECDESSALIGMLARHLNLHSVGLFYPTWNHTIAAWAPLAGKSKTGLILLPTTQIFLACDAGFDNTSFATQLKNIERYPNFDLPKAGPLPQPRAAWLIEQIRAYRTASPALWSLIRAKRAAAMNSSMGACVQARERWHQELTAHLGEGDALALATLAREELGDATANVRTTLAWLLD